LSSETKGGLCWRATRPRDSWIEGDEIKNVSALGEAKTSPNENRETFISEPEHASKNSSFLFDEVAIIFASGFGR
jgi:hypothetical protein